MEIWLNIARKQIAYVGKEEGGGDACKCQVKLKKMKLSHIIYLFIITYLMKLANCMYVPCMAITMFMNNILCTTVILAKLYTNYCSNCDSVDGIGYSVDEILLGCK